MLDSSLRLNLRWYFYYFQIYLNNMGWIRIRIDPELLSGSESGTRKIQSWIRLRNKSFRIRNTGYHHVQLVKTVEQKNQGKQTVNYS